MNTVSIETKNGPVRINQSDFNPDTDTLTDPQPEWSALFGAKVQPAAPTPPPANEPPTTPPVTPPAPPAPPVNETSATPPPPPVTEPPVPVVEMFVVKNENKWQITDNAGKPIEGKNGPDGSGYDTKKAAEEAKKAAN